jgi:hypothetical protein
MIALAGFTVGAVVACSADGSTDIPGDPNSTDPGTSTSGTDPGGGDNSGSMGTPTPTSTDAGKSTDSGKKPATDSGSGGGVDAGPPAPNPGDACTMLNSTFSRSCGFCGHQEAICLADDSGMTGHVTDYNTCSDEVANGCKPGTSQMGPCGMCGTQQMICQNNCQWAAGTCNGEPANACDPGIVNNSSAGCSAGTYRQQTCGVDCKYGNFTAACGPFVNPVVLQVSATLNGVVSHDQDIEVTTGKTFRPETTTKCPATSDDPDYPNDYVEVDNNTGKIATLTLYQSAVTGGDELDTVIWYYTGNTPPATTDVAREACTGSVNDSCASTTLCGSMDTFTFASIGSVVVPVGGKILVYSGGYDDTITGKMQINIRTDKLQ